MKRVLVTGSSGTIGTRLCELMLAHGIDLVGVDRRANKWHQELSRLTLLGDLCDSKFVQTLPGDIDVVIHLAANARVYNLVLEPDLGFENIRAIYNILEYCRINQIRRIIFASSREVYGNAAGTCRSEDQVDIHYCESPYTASKISGEALIQAYHRCYGMNYVIMRFSNVYGMYDDSDRVIPLFIRQARENQDLTVYGKDKVLDFTYIDDAVSGIIQCIQRFEQVKNNVFNIATGKGIRIIDVAQMIIEQLGSCNRVIVKSNRIGEVVRFTADISKAEHLLEYQAKTFIEEGIRKSIAWYAQHLLRTRASRSILEFSQKQLNVQKRPIRN